MSASKALRVAITGAEGGVGSILRERLSRLGHEVIAVSRTAPSSGSLEHAVETRVADLSSAAAAAGILQGADRVIHLAALPKPYEPWESVYSNNVAIDCVVFAEAAKTDSVTRLVYASTNHTQHGASMATTAETVNEDEWGAHRGRVHRLSDPPCPDSFYACAKLHGEALGRLYAAQHALQVFALRIGWIIPEDDPRAVDDLHKPFMRGMYLSHRDAEAIFSRALSIELPTHADTGAKFAHAYASSLNGRRLLDVDAESESARILGYTPVDDAETFEW